jgi:hypothetical protein
MHSAVFRAGIIALVLVVVIMVSVELAAGVWGIDRASRGVQLALQIGTLLLWIAVIAGFVLYPRAWRLYRDKKVSMDRDRRHLWLAILICGLPAAGYAAHIYLREGQSK